MTRKQSYNSQQKRLSGYWTLPTTKSSWDKRDGKWQVNKVKLHVFGTFTHVRGRLQISKKPIPLFSSNAPPSAIHRLSPFFLLQIAYPYSLLCTPYWREPETCSCSSRSIQVHKVGSSDTKYRVEYSQLGTRMYCSRLQTQERKFWQVMARCGATLS